MEQEVVKRKIGSQKTAGFSLLGVTISIGLVAILVFVIIGFMLAYCYPTN